MMNKCERISLFVLSVLTLIGVAALVTAFVMLYFFSGGAV